MQSTTKINMDEMSEMVSLYFGFDVSIFFIQLSDGGDDILVEWEKVENENSNN